MARIALSDDPAIENLSKIDHIVVLMMENRSFDHVLGYLKLVQGRAVDGLDAGMSNDYGGRTYPVRHATATALAPGQDLGHDGASVDAQIASGRMTGFVADYANGDYARAHPNEPVDVPMTYFDAGDLKVYDHLAANFVVCDRWFSSVPGATWPNRLYAVTGRCAGSRDNKKIPLYDLPAFVRHVPSWRWYAHNVASIHLIDGKYRVDTSHTSTFEHTLRKNGFLADAAQGKLPSVSWIDPDFGCADPAHLGHWNDDHPPADVEAGQELVLKLYNAVIHSPHWPKTLLVITYDEHGGFFDHRSPADVPPPADDAPSFRRYGVRVPAIVVSPWVEAGHVSSEVFDHTSIIKTILTRFCRKPDGTIPDMGARVAAANHLGSLLTATEARPAPTLASIAPLVAHHADRRREAFRAGIAMQAQGIAIDPAAPNDLQRGITAAKRELRKRGLPEGHP